jgi:hypothetical protein
LVSKNDKSLTTQYYTTMKRETGFIIAAFLLFFFEGAYSQVSQVDYFMKIPQNHFLNPAIKPSDRFYIGLPVLTGISAGIGNNFIGLNDLFANGSFVFDSPTYTQADLQKFVDKLKENNTISTDASIQLLGLGLSFGKDLYLYLDVMDRFAVKSVISKDLLSLYMLGYDGFRDQTLNLSGLNIKGQYFREYSVGFSKNITNNLRIGAKVKIISGLGSISFDNRKFTIKVNNDLSLKETIDASMDVSGKETFNRIFTQNNFLFKKADTLRTNFGGFLGDYLKNPLSNTGLGLDIGIVYNIGKLLTLSASVTDLGYIKWKNDLKSFKADSSFNPVIITMEDVVNKTFSTKDMVNSLLDTLKANFVNDPKPQPFTTYLPTSITVGVSINPLKAISFGILSNTRFYAGQAKESLTLSGNVYIGRVMSASVSYTIANYSYNNLGFGLAFKTGALAQIYIIADKIPLSWGKFEIGSGNKTIPFPSNFNMLNLQLGFNIVFGKPVTRKTDKPMLLEPK